MNKEYLERVKTCLADAVSSVIEDKAGNALDTQLARIRESSPDLESIGNTIAIAMPSATRSMGQAAIECVLPLVVPDEGKTACKVAGWTLGDAVRVLLLLEAILAYGEKTGCSIQGIIDICYRYGDDEERSSILKGIYWLDSEAEMVLFVIDAGRTNSRWLFAAIMQHNPYPAAYYNEAQYNQLLMKALFMDLSIEPVQCLQERRNMELARICGDFIEERLEAGRAVPASLWLALKCEFMDEELVGEFARHLGSDDVQQRYFTAKALTWQDTIPALIRDAVDRRRPLEDVTVIADLLADIRGG